MACVANAATIEEQNAWDKKNTEWGDGSKQTTFQNPESNLGQKAKKVTQISPKVYRGSCGCKEDTPTFANLIGKTPFQRNIAFPKQIDLGF